MAGQWDPGEQRAGAAGGVGSSLIIGAAVLLPLVLPLVVLWIALPALSTDGGGVLAESVARGGIGGALAYGLALVQWTLATLLVLAVQQWAWVLIGALGVLVAWVLRSG